MKKNSNDLVKLEKENAKLKSLIEKKHKVGNSEFWKRVWYSIWRNEELESENGKLEGKLADLQSEYVELENFKNNEVNELKEQWNKEHYQLTKAKEIMLKLSTCLEGHSNNNFEYELLQEAEQFLKEADE